MPPRPSRPRLIPGLSLRAGDVLAQNYRVTSLLRADRACAYLSASPTKKGEPAVEAQVLLVMDDGLEPVRLRFLAEARRVASLQAPSVLRVLEVGVTKDGYPFVLREASSGETLTSVLARLGSLPTESAVDIALAVCEALGAAHAQGIVHGELSPAVVRLSWTDGGVADVKLADLGVSRALAMLPLDARAIESLAISAPELLQSNREPDERADVWGLGVLLYTMLAGAPPFVSESPSTMNLSVALDEPAMLAGVPDGLGDVVDACLLRDPALRPATMELLASRLAPFGSRPVFSKRSSLLVVDTGPYEALVLETLVRAASPSVPPSAPSVEAADKTPEPSVVTSSVAPVALEVVPAVDPTRPVGAALLPREPKPRGSRNAALIAAACVAVGIVVGVGSSRLSAAPPPGMALVQAAPPPAEAALPKRDAPPPNVAPHVEPTAAPTTIAVADLHAAPAAPPRARAAAPAPKKHTAAPPDAPADPLLQSAAAPIHPVPKASDDDLRRFLDDRR